MLTLKLNPHRNEKIMAIWLLQNYYSFYLQVSLSSVQVGTLDAGQISPLKQKA